MVQRMQWDLPDSASMPECLDSVSYTHLSAIRDADRIIGLLEAEELKKIELVINRIRMDMVKRGDMMSVEDVVDILAIDLIGVVMCIRDRV